MSNQAWHPEALAGTVAPTLRALEQTSVLAGFYLAGGTGLALHLGHRRSRDLDFFSQEEFDADALLERLQRLSGFSLTARAPRTLHTVVQETRVSFLQSGYPLLFPLSAFEACPVADPRDIACMKISAIASRGTRRDFVDLFAASRLFGLRQLLELFERKFAPARYSMVHLLKSLTYFGDAEKDPMPDMLVSLAWQEVKEFFGREAPRLL